MKTYTTGDLATLANVVKSAVCAIEFPLQIVPSARPTHTEVRQKKILSTPDWRVHFGLASSYKVRELREGLTGDGEVFALGRQRAFW